MAATPPGSTKATGYSDKQTVRIMTIDKSRSRVECSTRDGAMIYAAVWESPNIFRWPKINEIWTVRKDAGIWRLDSQIRSSIEEESGSNITLSALPEGDTRILGTNVHVHGLIADSISTKGGTSSVFIDAREWVGNTPSTLDKGPQLQEALNAAKETGHGARLVLPPWEVVTGQELFQASYVALTGHGWGTSGIKLGDSTNTNILSVEHYGGSGIVDFEMRDFFINGNKSKNTKGSGILLDGSRFIVDSLHIFDCAEDNFNAQMTTEGVDTEGGMDSFISNLKCWLGGRYNIRINGHDWHLQNVVGIKKDSEPITTNILIDSEAFATKMVNVHAWGESKYAMVLKADVVAVNCEAEGGVTANVLLESDNGIWLGGKVFADRSEHGKKGFKWGNSKGFNWIIEGVRVDHCIEGAFDFTECDSGASRIIATVEQASGPVVIGSPSGLATIDLTVFGGATYEPPAKVSAPIEIETNTTGTLGLSVLTSGDTNARYEVSGSGQIGFGSGSSGADTFIQRTGTESLRLLGNVEVSKNFGANGATPQGKKEVTGSRSTGTAVASIITILQECGIIGTDGTSP